MTTDISRNPMLGFVMTLLTLVGPMVIAADLVLGLIAGWIAFAQLSASEPWARWTGSITTGLLVQIASVPMWLLIASVLSASLTAKRDGFSRHVLDIILRILAKATPAAETLRVGTTIPHETVAEWRRANATFASERATLVPTAFRKPARWALFAFANLLERVALGLWQAETRADGSIRLLDLPRVLGGRLDQQVLNRLWVATILFTAVSLGIQAGIVAGTAALFSHLSAPRPVPTAIE